MLLSLFFVSVGLLVGACRIGHNSIVPLIPCRVHIPLQTIPNLSIDASPICIAMIEPAPNPLEYAMRLVWYVFQISFFPHFVHYLEFCLPYVYYNTSAGESKVPAFTSVTQVSTEPFHEGNWIFFALYLFAGIISVCLSHDHLNSYHAKTSSDIYIVLQFSQYHFVLTSRGSPKFSVHHLITTYRCHAGHLLVSILFMATSIQTSDIISDHAT